MDRNASWIYFLLLSLSLYHPPCPVWGTNMNDTFNQIVHLVQEMCEVTFLRNASQKKRVSSVTAKFNRF